MLEQFDRSDLQISSSQPGRDTIRPKRAKSKCGLPLAVREQAAWLAILRSFENKKYGPKLALETSFSQVLDRLPQRPCDILDAGCGTGLLGRQAALRGHAVTGIDVLDEAVASARSHFPAFTADLEFVDLGVGKFDMVICSMVLMLIDDTPKLLAKMKGSLKTSGALALALLNPAKRQKKGAISDDDHDTWTFSSDGTPAETITYIWRSLETYIRIVRALGGHIELSYVDHQGLICPVNVLFDQAVLDAEFLWVLVNFE